MNKKMFYYQYDHLGSQRCGVPVFLITPKEYFDTEQCLSDSFYGENLPEEFVSTMSSVFEVHDITRDEAELLLKKEGHVFHYMMESAFN